MTHILVAGAGGFIGGALVQYLHAMGRGPIRAVDKKPIPLWHQRLPTAENLCLDLSDPSACHQACERIDEVYQLAADMGGMGFIERFRVECMRSVLINVHMLEAAYQAGVSRYFFASSACAYNIDLQQSFSHDTRNALRESDAYPAMAERGYGWEKLYGEMLCQEYWADRGLETHIARLHNVYGPHGTWRGGREKAPAAICRKVIEAKRQGDRAIEVWGDGEQRRSFMWIDDCVYGIDRITHCDDLIATPINLGSRELVSVNELIGLVESLAGHEVRQCHDMSAPRGVVARNSDNTMIRYTLGWEPGTPLRQGLWTTYQWIAEQMEYDVDGTASWESVS